MNNFIKVLSKLAVELSSINELEASSKIMFILNKLSHDVSREDLHSDKDVAKEVLEAEQKEINSKRDKLVAEKMQLEAKRLEMESQLSFLDADAMEISRRLRLKEEPVSNEPVDSPTDEVKPEPTKEEAK